MCLLEEILYGKEWGWHSYTPVLVLLHPSSVLWAVCTAPITLLSHVSDSHHGGGGAAFLWHGWGVEKEMHLGDLALHIGNAGRVCTKSGVHLQAIPEVGKVVKTQPWHISNYFHKLQPIIQRLEGTMGQTLMIISHLVPVLARAGVSYCFMLKSVECVHAVECMAFPFAVLVCENTDFCLCHQYPGKHGWQHYWALLQWGHIHPAHGKRGWRLQDHTDWDLASDQSPFVKNPQHFILLGKQKMPMEVDRHWSEKLLQDCFENIVRSAHAHLLHTGLGSSSTRPLMLTWSLIYCSPLSIVQAVTSPQICNQMTHCKCEMQHFSPCFSVDKLILKYSEELCWSSFRNLM